jgi:hypothetical protein
LILGILAALASRYGSWPKVDAARLVLPIICLLIVMAAASLVAGVVGYELAKAGGVKLPESLALRIQTDHRTPFIADLFAHQTAYGVGFVGGIVLCGWVLFRRRRLARFTPSTDDGKSNMDAEHQLLTIIRWTARTIGIVIVGLIAVSVIGEGGPNQFTASLRENLLGMALLTMAVGLLVGWKWEGIGGVLILGGFALFAAVNRPFRVNVVIVAWLITGVLYLACWWKSRRRLANRNLGKTGF